MLLNDAQCPATELRSEGSFVVFQDSLDYLFLPFYSQVLVGGLVFEELLRTPAGRAAELPAARVAIESEFFIELLLGRVLLLDDFSAPLVLDESAEHVRRGHLGLGGRRLL